MVYEGTLQGKVFKIESLSKIKKESVKSDCKLIRVLPI